MPGAIHFKNSEWFAEQSTTLKLARLQKRLHNPVLQYSKPERFRLINMVLIGELKEHADIVTKKFDVKM